MSHVSYLSKDQAAEELRPTFEGIERKLGAMPNLFRAMAHSPAVLQGFLALNGSLQKFELDPQLRELAYLKASAINGCDYCVAHHREAGGKAGLSERQIEGVAESESGDAYDDLQRDVLRFAEAVTRDVRADNALVGRLRARLSERALMELTLTVALANLTNRMNEALQIELP